MTHFFIERLEQRRLLSGQAAGWSDVIDNPYMPLLAGSSYTFKGVRDGETEINRVIVTSDTKQIQGVTCTVVLDRVFLSGKLAEKTYDWYAQDKVGNVWYFGEDSRDIENGKVASREGSFEAGVNGAQAGIIMKAHPAVGDFYNQESAVGVAEDQALVLSLHERAKVPFGTFGDCLQTKETTPLEPDTFEHKFYAPGIGVVMTQAFGGESETLKLTSFDLGPTNFVSTIDNPYMPFVPGMIWNYKGTLDGEAETNRTIVTADTKTIQGVTCTVVFDRVFLSGQLSEKTYDWYAQDKLGNVWYFGEDSRSIENGKVVDREGSWEAGVNGASPGMVMKANPGVGDGYRQEFAAGVAEDRANVLSLNVAATTPFATFGQCLETEDFSLLEPTVDEHKFFAAGIGLVKSQSFGSESEILKLVSFTP